LCNVTSYGYIFSCTDIRRLTTGIRSEKCVLGDFVVVRTSYSVLTQT